MPGGIQPLMQLRTVSLNVRADRVPEPVRAVT